MIFVILSKPAPFPADTKNALIPDFFIPKNTKFKIFTPKHTNSHFLTPGSKCWHRWQISGTNMTSGHWPPWPPSPSYPTWPPWAPWPKRVLKMWCQGSLAGVGVLAENAKISLSASVERSFQNCRQKCRICTCLWRKCCICTFLQQKCHICTFSRNRQFRGPKMLSVY